MANGANTTDAFQRGLCPQRNYVVIAGGQSGHPGLPGRACARLAMAETEASYKFLFLFIEDSRGINTGAATPSGKYTPLRVLEDLDGGCVAASVLERGKLPIAGPLWLIAPAPL